MGWGGGWGGAWRRASWSKWEEWMWGVSSGCRHCTELATDQQPRRRRVPSDVLKQRVQPHAHAAAGELLLLMLLLLLL